MNSNTQRKLAVILQYAQMLLSILISFIYTPIMLKILGQAEYGIYNLSNSIISYLSLLSLGFGASYIRFYSRYKRQDDELGIGRLNGLFLITFLLIGTVALVCGVLLSENVELFFNDTYTENDKSIAHVLMLFMSVNLALSFPTSVFNSYIMAQERFVFQKLLNIIRTIIGPFLTLPVLLMGWGSIGMVVVTTVVGLFVDVVNILFCISKLKMRFDMSHPDFMLLKEIAGFSVFIAINQVIDQINWMTDKMILGKVCSSSAVAVYTIGAQINTYFTSFSTAISSVFVPQIHRIENTVADEKSRNHAHTELFVKVGRIQFMLLILILTGFIFFGRFFIRIWAGPDYGTSYYVALLLMCPAAIPLIQNIGIEVQRAKNKHQFRSIVYLIMAILNVAISIIFAMQWGEIGAAFGTTISLVIANGVVMNIFYHKVIKLDMLYFWREITKFIPALILPIGSGVILTLCYSFRGVLDFMIFIVVYLLIYCISMYLFGMNQSEKKLITKLLLRRNRGY